MLQLPNPACRQGTSSAPRPTKKVAKASGHPDAELIRCCIEYAAQIAGASAAYSVDPTDAEFASPLDSSACRRADRAMRAALELPPKTVDGLNAKAKLIDIVFKDWETSAGAHLDQLRMDFIASIAKDIIRLHSLSPSPNEQIVAPGQLLGDQR